MKTMITLRKYSDNSIIAIDPDRVISLNFDPALVSAPSTAVYCDGDLTRVCGTLDEVATALGITLKAKQ